ncbi:hypothetical protein BU16DRAFT_580492 [Lophium mytilinum]|uniref:Uncharacterized protein n=1 Tax=Lophium mytilinum TaxID=390894 RepID=A0A6A6QZK9_9PEZI|nr:hypothetical protein BU16DRAFT_580492 [Lophium mytilinum]
MSRAGGCNLGVRKRGGCFGVGLLQVLDGAPGLFGLKVSKMSRAGRCELGVWKRGTRFPGPEAWLLELPGMQKGLLLAIGDRLLTGDLNMETQAKKGKTAHPWYLQAEAAEEAKTKTGLKWLCATLRATDRKPLIVNRSAEGRLGLTLQPDEWFQFHGKVMPLPGQPREGRKDSALDAAGCNRAG